MTRRRKLLLGLLIVSLIGVTGATWWYARSQSSTFRIVWLGSRGSSDNFSVVAGNLVIDAPKPGLLFGTETTPGNPEQLAYVVLFKYGHPRPHQLNVSSPSSSSFKLDSRKAETKSTIELIGRRIEVSYNVELNEARTAIAHESLAVDGKSKDLASGRVFLVDLTAETPVYQQKNVNLPAIPFKLDSTADVERLAGMIRKTLEGQDLEMEPFLR